MFKDEPKAETNYCPMCEQSRKELREKDRRIAELERLIVMEFSHEEVPPHLKENNRG